MWSPAPGTEQNLTYVKDHAGMLLDSLDRLAANTAAF